MIADTHSRRRARTGAARPTNVSLDTLLVAEAKSLGVNISAASARGLDQAVGLARAERWRNENKEALAAWNDYAEAHGLPLQHLRRF